MHIHLCTARFQVGVDTPTDVTSPGLVRLSTRIVIRLRNYIYRDGGQAKRGRGRRARGEGGKGRGARSIRGKGEGERERERRGAE